MRRLIALSTLPLIALATASCAETVSPTSPGISDAPQPVAAASAQSTDGSGPVVTPFETPPVAQNREEILGSIEDEYPPALREAGVAGRVGVWIYIDSTGTVSDAVVARGSGHDALDQAALRVGETMKFSPATYQDEPVAVWVQVPVTFGIG